MILVILIIEEDTKNHILTIEDHITNHIPNLNPTVVQMKKKDILLENLNGDSEVLKKEDLLETLTTKKKIEETIDIILMTKKLDGEEETEKKTEEKMEETEDRM